MKKRNRKLLPVRERCTTCDGRGERQRGFLERKRWMDCEACGGSGRRSDEIYRFLSGVLPNETHFYDEP